MSENSTREPFTFSVDTHLFRELGELLVGRDSTALMELIKNAYDADATRVVVRGDGLRTANGSITVSDDGIGMTPEVFQGAFLRIAGRYKERGSRRSPRFERRYTGAKGVGRLSAHKLAQRLEILSVPWTPLGVAKRQKSVRAVIDWQRVEDDYETLEDATQGLDVRSFYADPDQPSGTRLRLENLRRRWTPRALEDFVLEVSSCTPPPELTNAPPDSLFDSAGLFEEVSLSSRLRNDPGFEIQFEGELDAGEDLWPLLLEQADWLIEISAAPDGVLFNIKPSRALAEASSEMHEYRLRRDHPNPEAGPFFTSRIYARHGSVAGIGARTSTLRKFAKRSRGVRVYVEGFRVLPYGDAGDDWLNLDRDYARRQTQFDIDLDPDSSRLLAPVEKEAYLVQGNDQYVGAVFLTGEGAAALRPVVNREGFVHDPAYETLRELVRNGVDLLTRVRAAQRRGSDVKKLETLAHKLVDVVQEREAVPEGRAVTTQPVRGPSAPQPTDKSDDLSLPISVARKELRDLHQQLGDNAEASPRLERVERVIDYIEEAQKGDDGRATLQILAGVGLQLAAFVHDINGVLGLAQAIRSLADATRREPDATKRKIYLRELEAAANELVQSLSRQSSYLVEVVGPDARRRRRRIPFAQAIQPSLQFLTGTIAGRGIEIKLDLDAGGKTPPIFPAEIAIIVTNILTNAIKAVGEKGCIWVVAKVRLDGGLLLRVENTGVRVDLARSERWFRPFESTTTEVDVVLGQGMGMGLPIVRRLVSEYNGSVNFVDPSHGFDTAIEVLLPGRRIGQ
ncbi:ATP-binding protein [Micromonospora sp. H33]|uniref:ATP-binding protein n=1 Tax=Micromonospora sp. H33 TaxID=3452215 RepID=UPI003F8ACB50